MSRGWLWTLAVAAVAAAAAVLPAVGAVRVDALSAPKDAAPGEVVAHVFAIVHDGAAAATFALSAGAPVGWAILGVPPEITVLPGEEGVVFVTLTIPGDAAAGLAVITLRATSVADPSDDASAGIATRVSVVNRLELEPPDGRSVSPGDAASYVVRIANRGNAQDVVVIAASSSRGYPVEVGASSVELAPQETRDVGVTVTVPAGAGPGRDVLTVRATSTLYNGVEDEIAVFTTVLPPGPDAVGGTLFEVLPTRSTLEVEHNETTNAFDSRLSLAMTGPVLDGTFSAAATVDHPFGSDPVEITAYSLSYRTDRASFAVGTVSQSLTDLHSMACDGGSVTVTGDSFRTALVAGGADEETRFGGRLSLGPEEAQVGVAFSDRRDPAARWAAWSGLASAEPMSGWTLRAEGGRGVSDGKTGRAALFGTTIDTDLYFLSATAFSVGTYYPGPRQDRAGIEAAQRLRLDGFSFALSLGHVWTNVVRDPLAATLVADSLGLNISTAPWHDGPTVQSTVTFERKRQDGGVPRDDVAALVGYHVGEARSPFPYSFSGKIADRIDLLLGTRERTMTHTQEVGLSIDELVLSLRLAEEQTVDLVHDVVLTSGGSATLVVRPGGTPHEASIEFRSSAGNRLELEAGFVLHPIDDVAVSFGGSATWTRGDPTAARFGWHVGVETTLGIPLAFLVTKGRVVGHVFVDRNANGVFDEDDAPAPAAVVFLEAAEVSTDASGRYRFLPLAPGAYSLDVRNLPLDAVSPGSIAVRVTSGAETRVDVPLAPVLRIRGAVFDDRDQDGLRQPSEPGFHGVRILFVDAARETSTTTSDARGDFVFTARPGVYTVSLDHDTLPERFSYTTAETQAVNAATADLVLFGGFLRPRPVVVTFQPPTADAAFTPAAPRAGESVTFDGSGSFDFDGTIVGYAWDFDGDGTADSTDAVARHAFALPGRYRVTLTVTDDAGNQDVASIEVAVEAAGSAPVTSAAPTPPPPSGARSPVADYVYDPVAPAAGRPVTFDASGSVDFDGGIADYAWDFNGDGTADAHGVTATWSFPASGSFPVALTVTDVAGLTDRAVYPVDVAAAPVSASPGLPQAEFAYEPAAPRVGSVTRFHAATSSDPAGGVLAYAWDFDDDARTDAEGVVAEWVFAAAGSVPVTLTVSTPDGRVGSRTITVSVQAAPGSATGGQPPIAVLEFAPLAPRAGELVLLSSTGSVDFDGTIAAVAWDFTSDGLVDSTQAVASTTYAAAGDVVVTLTVYDDDGNSDTVTATVPVR